MAGINLRQHFLEHLAQTSDIPLMIEVASASGSYIYDTHGKAYIDLISGIAVSNTGHRHPKVIDAIKKQLDSYLHVMVYGEFIQSPQVQLAEKLKAHTPAALDHVYFVNSGAEAVEGALKLAKRYTGKTEIISCRNAYHGSTHGALSAGGEEKFKQAYRPLLPGFKQIRHGYEDDLAQITPATAAVIIETIQGEAGVVEAPAPYFRQLSEQCRQTGTLLIADEIQCGFGRTGKLWAFEHYDFVPDILLMAKGMGGGMPLGALMAPQSIMEVFKSKPVLGHITTFGGHPVSCTASMATLDVIMEEKMIDTVSHKEKAFRELLQHPAIQTIKSKGLLMALHLDNFENMRKVIIKAIEKGLITDWFLFCDHALRIAPPINIDEATIAKACDILNQAIKAVYD